MSGMFWITLELSIPKIGLNIMLFSTVKKLDAFKFDGVAESGNTAGEAMCSIFCRRCPWCENRSESGFFTEGQSNTL